MSTSNTVDMLRRELRHLGALHRDDARTMPSSFYTSAEFLEVEKEELFRREWICIGHAGEVPKPGDYFTTELVGEQLLVARDADGEINVLSNVCRHRGNLVAEGRGNRRSFVCQYHAWTYDLGGQLKTAPLMKARSGFDVASCRLPRIKSELWSNFIFVNLDGEAAPLSERLRSLDGVVHNYHNELRTHLFEEEDVWGTNWKNLNENFMEGYHLASTHPKTLEPMTPTSGCVKVEGNGAWTAYRAYYTPDWPERGPYHEDLTDDEKRNSVLFNIFPSFVCSFAPNYTLYLCLRPAGPDQVAIRWGATGFKEDPDDPEVRGFVDLCKAFNAEDREKLETLQRAQNTRFYTPGPLAPDDYEGTIWDFLTYMAGRLGTSPAPRAAGAAGQSSAG